MTSDLTDRQREVAQLVRDGWIGPDGLTDRQREVRELVRDGWYDKQIAARLGISERRVRQINACIVLAWKLDRTLDTRVQIAKGPAPGFVVGRKPRVKTPQRALRIASARLRWLVLERDGHRCQGCGASVASGATLQMDHIIPWSRGGRTTFENLRALCEPCNRGKSNDMPDVDIGNTSA